MKTMIQFHAALKEIIDFANDVSAEQNLAKVLTFEKIDQGIYVKESLIESDLLSRKDGCIPTRIMFLISENPKPSELSLEELLKPNSTNISINLGLLSSKGLHESGLSFMSDDTIGISTVRKVSSRLKKLTVAGATAVSTKTSAEANIRTHRYTAGAKKLYDEGVKILPFAGNSYFKLH